MSCFSGLYISSETSEMARSANMISRGSIALAEKAGSSHFSSERCAPLWGYNVQEM